MPTRDAVASVREEADVGTQLEEFVEKQRR